MLRFVFWCSWNNVKNSNFCCLHNSFCSWCFSWSFRVVYYNPCLIKSRSSLDFNIFSIRYFSSLLLFVIFWCSTSPKLNYIALSEFNFLLEYILFIWGVNSNCVLSIVMNLDILLGDSFVDREVNVFFFLASAVYYNNFSFGTLSMI